MTDAVVWHDLECHGYTADLELWRKLALSPVLDVGAGTGRVAIDLAALGHEVVALDRDPDLLSELHRREPGIETACADAQSFELGRTFASILVPMQTIQLLPDRRAFLRRARAHLAPLGILAVAVADALEPFDASEGLPLPEVVEREGRRFSSQPVAMEDVGTGMRIERIRTAWGSDGERRVEGHTVELAKLDAGTLEQEAAVEGFTPVERRRIPETDEHVGSVVVVLHA